ncbi:MAG: L-rhamnose isomerase, partial [Lachnospiraceae bacterium]|nr:L-rhamnose isomerase [Lachnospiraceae bacterium]
MYNLYKCRELGKIPVSVGIDTWAVDFVLLDQNDKRIGNAVAYRDERTKNMDEKVYELVAEKELYSRTGIQKQIFNTIYQLMALKVKNPAALEKASKLLMIPDYFNFLLTGKAVTEYTNATTTQLVNARSKEWDEELIQKLGYPVSIFQQIKMPGTELGSLKEDIAKEVGYTCNVVLPATHDTGSAVVAVPVAGEEEVLYISSGTWSLMGTELQKADCSEESRQHNLTNEGGYQYRFRYLKNIMGLWMIQSVKKEIGGALGFGEICEAASKCDITSIVDCNDDRFLAPANMTEEVKAACRESGQKEPEGIAEAAAVIYNSLAKCYADARKEIEDMTGKSYGSIHIIGGGANADYLNRLTAKATGNKVLAGPVEATAIGNLAVQMIADGVFSSLEDARKCISESQNGRYEEAKKKYAAVGVDTDAAIRKLMEVPVSLHCWQGDDVTGFDHDGPLTGGIQTTGDYPGKARTPEELMQDMDQALKLMPGKKKLNLHASYAVFGEGEFADRDKIEPKHFAK